MAHNTADPSPARSQPSRLGLPTYVLVTPARNEAAFIEHTITSVIAQTVRPIRWVIVSDGSTDGTDEIVKKYVARYDWIELVRMPERSERHFAGKVHAFTAGQTRLGHLNYDIIGNLDADISFDPDYFAFLLDRFDQMPELGVAGTPFREDGFQYNYTFVSLDHVSGACQLFRRQCFEDVGGYKPIREGGVDWLAVTTARMLGWKTRTFPEKSCLHLRKIGSAKGGLFKSKLRVGRQDYYLGGHPLWEVFRALYQMTLRPYILGGSIILLGYMWAFVRRHERPIPQDLIAFRRAEQMQRLRMAIGRILGPLRWHSNPARRHP